ncbi:aldehyde-activating protein [Xanthomonas euroxanthea]|uniref:Aldehyde-activating protein n=1 Tax=Xanthomonas euroxanthea TaxID=2259622 RepID=A0AA46CA20_9XANT|nr:aldehyde-activating protein [Xanthomonas euroxanthea]CAE1137394.1 aldehyde-activating protein [Xanthomonas euroxanthea]SUZ29214.1 aldehyde-activating protein [Xanthomonas euroxanthea]
MHHAGSCHCGRSAFELETDAPITGAHHGNGPLGRGHGGLPWFGMRRQSRLQGEPQALGAWRIDQQRIEHSHCRQCGSAPISAGMHPGAGEPALVVKLRCVPELAAPSMHAVAGAGR